MTQAFFEEDLRQKLWVQYAKTTTELDGILIQKNADKTNYKNMFGTTPVYIRHLRIFGVMGIV